MEPKSDTVDQSPFRTQAERAVEREQKREAVLRAAVRMFNSQGFHATSLDDVAASLGVSKPTIYHYLGAKDQVLLECLTYGVEQLLAVAAGPDRGVAPRARPGHRPTARLPAPLRRGNHGGLRPLRDPHRRGEPVAG